MRIYILFFFLLLYNFFCFSAEIPSILVTPKKIRFHSLTLAPKTLISRESILENGAGSLSQILQELGGVQLKDTTGNNSQVLLSLRGFGANASSNTLVLINGIPITNPDLMPPDLNAIPIQEIELIEITTGTESVLYGDQAVGGSINFLTKPAIEKVDLSCSFGSFNQHQCYGTLHHRIKQFDLGVNVLNQHSDNYRVHNNYDQNLLSGNINFLTNINFDYQIEKERMQYPGALTSAQARQNPRQSTNISDFFQDRAGRYHLHQRQLLPNGWNFELDLARRDMHGNGVLTSPFTQARITHFLKPIVKGNLGKAFILSGVDVEDDRYSLQTQFGLTRDSQQKYGLFTIVNFPVNSNMNVSLGARGAQQDNYLRGTQWANQINRAFATNLGITYAITAESSIFLRRAESFRFPKADEDSFTPIGVDGLKTQRGVSYETGITSRFRNLYSKLNLYQLNLKDEITFDPLQTPRQPFGANRNLDPTVRKGFSFAEKFQLSSQLSLNGQYNYVSARFQSGINKGNRIPLVAEQVLNGGLNYKLTEQWNLYGEAIFTGNQFAANDDLNILGKQGGYTIYNANLRYHFKNLSMALRLNNIFNKRYYLYTVLQSAQEFFYPAAGRNILFTVKYEFI